MNDNFPRGFQPLNLNFSRGVHYYRMSTADDVFLHQPVRIDLSGVVRGTSGQSVEAILGVAMGFLGPNKAGLASDAPFLDVSQISTNDVFVAVSDDPNQEYVVQGDTVATLAVEVDVGTLTFDVNRGATAATSGDTTTGYIASELDQSTGVTSSAGMFQFLRFHDFLNFDGTENTSGNFAKMVIQIYHHQKRGGENAVGQV